MDSVAIIGIGCRLPGGANSPEALWRMLLDGVDAIRQVPRDRWDMRRFFDPDPTIPGKIYAREAGFLTEPIDSFDAGFFGISPREAAVLDPQQRLLLEVAWESMEDAAIDAAALRGSRTGVFIGGFNLDNKITQLGMQSRHLIVPNTATSSTMVMLSNRLSYTFDLRGPSLSVDTACSSSLAALHLAARSLQAGECDAAFAGGVNVMTRPEYSIAICQGGFLSPTSRCRAFDQSADGYVRGEGAGILLLKRLDDAVRDQDRIYAVIRATGANQDGRTPGITVPSQAAQEALIREVCQNSGVDPASVHVAEAHGTGTQTGDPIEAGALGAVLGQAMGRTRPLWMGSLKTNVGHLEAAAGVAGVIKLALVLHHRKLPPNLHFKTPNPKIDLDALRIAIPTEVQSLPAAETLFGVVNSFGYGGTNAHALLSSPPVPVAHSSSTPPSACSVAAHRRTYVVSAADEVALKARARLLGERLTPNTDLEAWGATLAHGRTHMAHRAAIVAANPAELRAGLDALANGRALPGVVTGRAKPGRKPVFVYSGMGAQWWGMGDALYADSAVFRQTINECDAIWRDLGGDSLIPWFRDGAFGRVARGEAMDEPAAAQPANVMLQIGLTRAWNALGVEPVAILGHSVGEIAACYAAGALPLEQVILLVFHRSRLQQRLVGMGGMLAVGLSPDEAARLVEREGSAVVIAAINSNTSVTLSGDNPRLDAIAAQLQKQGVFARRLRVAVPYHSPRMDVLEAEFRAALSALTPNAPTTPLYSTLFGARVTGAIHHAEYWLRNASAPVLFRDALGAALADGHDTFVELGPHPVLSVSIEELARGRDLAPCIVHSMKRESPQTEELLMQSARLYVGGASPNWSAWFHRSAPVPLPAYPWQHGSFWHETAAGRLDRVGAPDAPPLLQRRMPEPHPAWESELNRHFLPWLADHQVDGLVVFPGAAYVAAALDAARLMERPAVVRNFRFALALMPGNSCRLRVGVDAEGLLQFYSRHSEEAPWALHASCRLVEQARPAASLDLIEAPSTAALQQDAASLYAELAARGLMYGPVFRCIRSIHASAREFQAALELAPEVTDAQHWPLHPAMLDAAFQAFLATAENNQNSVPMVPVSIEEIRFLAALPRQIAARGRVKFRSHTALLGDIDLVDEAGVVCVQVRGLRCQAVPGAEGDRIEERLYEEVWKDAEVPAIDGGRWVVLHGGHNSAYGTAITQKLRLAGVDAHLDAPLDGSETGVVLAVSASAEDVAGIEASAALLQLLQSVNTSASRLVVVTREDAIADAALAGLARVARNEYLERVLRLVVEQAAASGPLAGAVTGASTETEWSVRGFETRVRRLQRFQRKPQVESVDDAPAELIAERAGSTDSLTWTETQRRAPGPGELELEVRGAPLNFKDLIKVMGMLPASYLEKVYSGSALGLEASGVVTRLGEGVTEYSVGQAIVTPSRGGCMRTHITESTQYVVTKPQHQSFAEAGCYINFITAHYGFLVLGRLAPGERVLIHSATGGVGLAAIQVARAAGAEVFATAGTEEKRAYLRGLGLRHVYDSRTLAFADAIVAEAGGVDVVLNSQPGDLQRRSMEILKPYGRFIEIGKRGILDDAALRLAEFDRNLSFSAIDIDRMMADNPPLFRRLLDEVHACFESGVYTAIPTQVFRAADAAEAFRTLARGQHLGKIAVSMDGSQSVRRLSKGRSVRSDRTYLITGGFGGFGRALARWLVENGARHVLLASRSGNGSAETSQFLASLCATGAEVRGEAIDVSDRDAVHALIGRLQASAAPLGGIFHAAMVLDDGFLRELSAGRLARVMRPKALGAVWLDEASADADLDFFVLFSSISAITGNPGQGSYVAANAVLDRLAERRRLRGQRALSVAWGVLRDAGVVARNPELEQHLTRLGIQGMSAAECLRALSYLLGTDAATAGVFELDWERWAESTPEARAPRFSAFVSATGRGVHPLAAELEILPPAEAALFIENALCAQLTRVLQIPRERIDVELSLENMGVDSLMAVELAIGLRAELRVDLPTMLLMQGPSVRTLAQRILSMILPQAGLDEMVNEMTEAELDALLASEMTASGQEG